MGSVGEEAVAGETVADVDLNGESAKRPRVLDLFAQAKKDGRPLHISAPMVRYSKLPFRLLISRHYSVDITYTPMILAHEFVRSAVARDSDFSTSPLERQSITTTTGHDGRAVIAQFASNSPEEFARASEMVAPWVDGVDLNCGCPQSWAMKEGIGCSLMESPELVARMVRAAKRAVGEKGVSVSVKIRIHKDLARTVEFVRLVEEAGVDFVTVHGRLRNQRSSTKPDLEAIRIVKESVRVPVVANGDIYSLRNVRDMRERTAVDGVMAARGILENPALFAGVESTPVECVQRFLGYAVRCPIPFALVLHHASEMTGGMEGMGKGERRRLMECKDLVDLIDFVEGKWGLGERVEMK